MTTVTQADRANADKAFDIAFRGDTDGIDEAMAELFASARESAETIEAEPLKAIQAGLWLDLCEKDDRTSPEEYPDMCLISEQEHDDAITYAYRQGREAGAKAMQVSQADEWNSYMTEAVSNAPQPLRQLGEYLAGLLDEDHWKTAERYLNAAAILALDPAQIAGGKP